MRRNGLRVADRPGNAAGVDVWFTIPLGSTADYVTKLQQLCMYGSDGTNPYTGTSGSNPTRQPLVSSRSTPPLVGKAIFEQGNETWNTKLSSYYVAEDASKVVVAAAHANGTASDLEIGNNGTIGTGDTNAYNWQQYFVGKKIVECYDSGVNVFPQGSFGVRWGTYAMGQTGYYYPLQLILAYVASVTGGHPSTKIEKVGGHWYQAPALSAPDPFEAAYNAADPTQGHSIEQVLGGGLNQDYLAAAANTIAQLNVDWPEFTQFAGYEGGVAEGDAYTGGYGGQESGLSKQVQADNRYQDFVNAALQAYFNAGGNEPVVFAATNQGDWSVYRNIFNLATPKGTAYANAQTALKAGTSLAAITTYPPVTVPSNVTAVSLTPLNVVRTDGGGTIKFTGSVTTINGSPTTITWSVSGSPHIFTDGTGLVSLPPAIQTQQILHVTMTPNSDTAQAITTTITIPPTTATVSGVAVYPPSVTVLGGQSVILGGVVAGSNGVDQTLDWSTQGSPAGLTVNSIAAFYTLPAATSTQQTFTAVGTSTVDPSKSGTATIIVPATGATLTAPSALTMTAPEKAGATGSIFNLSITLDNPAGSGGVPVTLTSSLSGVTFSTPSPVTIPAGTNSLRVLATMPSSAGVANFTATAPGLTPATFTYTTQPSTPTPTPTPVAPSAPTLTITSSGGNDTISYTAPVAGTNAVGGTVIFRGVSPGSESSTIFLTHTGTGSGSFTTPSGGYSYTGKSFDVSTPPLYSVASNEVTGAAGSSSGGGGIVTLDSGTITLIAAAVRDITNTSAASGSLGSDIHAVSQLPLPPNQATITSIVNTAVNLAIGAVLTGPRLSNLDKLSNLTGVSIATGTVLASPTPSLLAVTLTMPGITAPTGSFNNRSLLGQSGGNNGIYAKVNTHVYNGSNSHTFNVAGFAVIPAGPSEGGSGDVFIVGG